MAQKHRGYRCYFLDENKRIREATDFVLPDDWLARSRAESLKSEKGYPAIELWQGSKLLYFTGQRGDDC